MQLYCIYIRAPRCRVQCDKSQYEWRSGHQCCHSRCVEASTALGDHRATVLTMRLYSVIAILSLLCFARPRPADADITGHAGLNLRADNGAHQIRAMAGFDTGAFDLSLTLDPMVITDGQLDTDLLATWRVTDAGWGVITGFRNTRIGILGGQEYQEKLILGVGAPLPLLGDSIRIRWGL